LTPYAGPKTFAKEYNREEVERLADEVARLTRELAKNQPPLPVGAILRAGAALVFDTLNRVHPPAAGLTMQMPRATPTDGGKGLEVAVMSAAGVVTFIAPGATVNGAASYAAATAIALIRFRWDGAGWWV
jgi:hypothetical protein